MTWSCVKAGIDTFKGLILLGKVNFIQGHQKIWGMREDFIFLFPQEKRLMIILFLSTKGVSFKGAAPRCFGEC
jgi:hypothetical protein